LPDSVALMICQSPLIVVRTQVIDAYSAFLKFVFPTLDLFQIADNSQE